jgi:hypothetical protein
LPSLESCIVTPSIANNFRLESCPYRTILLPESGRVSESALRYQIMPCSATRAGRKMAVKQGWSCMDGPVAAGDFRQEIRAGPAW